VHAAPAAVRRPSEAEPPESPRTRDPQTVS
jgi:hypothetical protein